MQEDAAIGVPLDYEPDLGPWARRSRMPGDGDQLALDREIGRQLPTQRADTATAGAEAATTGRICQKVVVDDLPPHAVVNLQDPGGLRGAKEESAVSVGVLPDTGQVDPLAGRAAQIDRLTIRRGAGTPITVPADGPGNLCANGVLGLVFDTQSPGAAGVMGPDLATGQATGEWMRLYLFDAPEGSSMRTLAVAIVAPESRFERAMETAAPAVDSVEFH